MTSTHDTYVLHIWSSRAVAGQQWVARVEHLGDGQRYRFADPDALLDHLRTLLIAWPLDGQVQVDQQFELHDFELRRGQ